MARAPLPTSLEEIAERLRLIGSPSSAWHNYEAGIRRISLDQALRLKRATGLTLEWIYTGDISSLPPHLGDKIRGQITKETKQSSR